MGRKKSAILRELPGPVKLDLGCGTRKATGYHGVDALAFDGVDTVADLRQPWPWKDGTVDEVHSSHFVEHLENPERVHFFNELYRVLKLGGKALIITPHWSNACAYGDPTHCWPPVSEWMAFYLDKNWRAVNAPHAGYTCDFEWVAGFGMDERIMAFNPERQHGMLAHSINSARDLHLTLTKR